MAQQNTKKRGRPSTTATGPSKRQATARGTAKNRANDGATAKQYRRSVETAKLEVRDRADEVLSFIEAEKSRPVHTDDANKKRLSAALSPSLRQYLSAVDSNKPCEAFDDALMAIQQFKEIVTGYETINKANAGIVGPKWMRWKQDVTDLRALNETVMDMSCQISRGLVMPGPWKDLSITRAKGVRDNGEVAKLAAELVDEALPERAEDTWGATAYRLAKTYGRLLKDIS